MERNVNIKIDIDDRAPTSYNDLIKIGDSINLTIDLSSKGESVDLKDSSVELFLKKEDGTKVEQEVIIGDSKVSCTPLNIQSTTAVGQVCGELVVESSGKQVTSSTFIFNVEGSTSSEILEESKDDIATIKSLQNTIVNVNSVVEKYKTNIETIAGTSESIEALAQIKIYAESVVKEIETVVNTGNTLKTSLESENTRAENNIQELNNLGSESIKTHINNTDIHVAASDKTKWDSYEQLISDNTSHLNERANKGFIINSDFQIWQRGESFILGGPPQYSSDRWAVGSSTSQALKIEKVDSGLKMTWLKQENGVITQYLELPDKKRLIGKKISISISINNLIYTYTTILDDINKYINFDLSNKVFTVGTHTDTKYYIRLFHSEAPIGTTYVINHIRDVFGSVSNFIPMSYGEELAMCQRYYEEGFIWGNYMGLIPYQSFHCPFKVVKRIVPTVVYEDPNVSGTTVSVQTDAIYQDGHNCIVSSSVGNSGTAYRFQVKYKASADIY